MLAFRVSGTFTGNFMRREYLAEAIGTFALVFAGTGAIVINDVSGGAITHGGIALTFGLIVMSMIYAFGDLSGAHLNPAVTIGFFIAGRAKASSVIPYVLFQIAGAAVASLLLKILFRDHLTLGATIPAGSVWQSFVMEVVLTYLLMLVILQVSSGSKEVGTLAGIAIGGVVALEAMFAGPICGASMNPARSITPAIFSGNGAAITTIWIYIAAPLLGAILAVPTHHYLRTEPKT
jgi:aquaporin NIP